MNKAEQFTGYKIITDLGLIQFEAKIENLMREGWEPVGSFQVGHGGYYMQAMTKKDIK